MKDSFEGQGQLNELPLHPVEKEREAIMRHSELQWVHWVVICLSLALTLAAWQYSKYQIRLRTEARFEFAANQVVELLAERLQKYELALWSGVAHIKAQKFETDSVDWRTFADSLRIEERYHGINGIGIIYELAPSEIEDFIADQRRNRPTFAVHPAHDRDVFQPITFIEPEAQNAAAVGLDMAHETNRHTSFNKARDTGTPQITGPIVLVQDAQKTPGFLFYAPAYRDANTNSVEERRAGFVGAVYAPFVVTKLMQGTLAQDSRNLFIRISDSGEVIYDEFGSDVPDYDPDPIAVTQLLLPLYGRIWTIDIRAGQGFRSDNAGFESTAILIIGLVIDATLFALFVLLSRANRRGIRFADTATAALRLESSQLRAVNEDLAVARCKAEEASRAKSVFLSTMSHEIRTPLNAVMGILQLLERSGADERQTKLLHVATQASQQLLNILNSVLEASRLEAHAVKLYQTDVALRPLFDEWKTMLEGLVSKSGKPIAVTACLSDSFPDIVRVDRSRLSQILSNLVDNAVRFTQSGAISIEAGLVPDSDRDMFEIRLVDSGLGIPENELENVFERFRQVDGSITRGTGGAGLGLSICSDLVKLMEGEISVTSQTGKGTTFYIRLPVNGATVSGGG